jgi:hypothetical protein
MAGAEAAIEHIGAAGCAGETPTPDSAAPLPGGRKITDKGAFLPQFLAYLYARKWRLLIPIVVIGLLLILAAALLFGSDVALTALYQIF